MTNTTNFEAQSKINATIAAKAIMNGASVKVTRKAQLENDSSDLNTTVSMSDGEKCVLRKSTTIVTDTMVGTYSNEDFTFEGIKRDISPFLRDERYHVADDSYYYMVSYQGMRMFMPDLQEALLGFDVDSIKYDSESQTWSI